MLCRSNKTRLRSEGGWRQRRHIQSIWPKKIYVFWFSLKRVGKGFSLTYLSPLARWYWIESILYGSMDKSQFMILFWPEVNPVERARPQDSGLRSPMLENVSAGARRRRGSGPSPMTCWSQIEVNITTCCFLSVGVKESRPLWALSENNYESGVGVRVL